MFYTSRALTVFSMLAFATVGCNCSGNSGPNGPLLATLTVTPEQGSVPIGGALQYAAIGSYADGTTKVLTNEVLWTTGDGRVAAVSNDDDKGVVRGMSVGATSVTATLNEVSAAHPINVTLPEVTAIEVTPQISTLAQGRTITLKAVASLTDLTEVDITAQANWSASSAGIDIDIDPMLGTTATAKSVGDVEITATFGNQVGTLSVTVTDPQVVSLELEPIQPTLAVGSERTFFATGTFTDQTTSDVTDLVTWASSSPSVARVSDLAPTKGRVTALTSGLTNITATLGSVHVTTQVAVTTAELVGLTLSHSSVHLAAGTTLPLTATGTFSDNSTQDLTSQVTWSCDDTQIADFSNLPGLKGTVKAGAPGIATLRASTGSYFAEASVVVSAATLVSLAVTPPQLMLPKGAPATLVAVGTFSDKTTQPLSDQVTWASNDEQVIVVSNQPGVQGHALTGGLGQATVTASLNGLSVDVPVSVTSATLASIAITPPQPKLAVLTALNLAATGTYTDGSTQDLTQAVTWGSSDQGVAQMSNLLGSRGRLSALTAGTCDVTAVFAGITGTQSVEVSSATLLSLDVTPKNPSAPSGLAVQLFATGFFSDNSSQDLTPLVSWVSADSNVVSVASQNSAAGLATAHDAGTVSVSASLNGQTNAISFSATNAQVTSLTLSPVTPAVPAGLSTQLSLVGHFTDGTSPSLTSLAHWSSSDETVAQVSNAPGSEGLLSALVPGAVTVTATYGGKSVQMLATVNDAQVVSLAVTPGSVNLPAGMSAAFTATGTMTDNTQRDVTEEVVWSSSDENVVQVSNASGSNGVATALSTGAVTLTATSGSVTQTATFTVAAAQLLSISISPGGGSQPKGVAQKFTATGSYTDGHPRDVTSQVTWLSSNNSVLSISNAPGTEGAGQTLGVGTVTVTANLGGKSANTSFTVAPAQLVSMAVTPGSTTAPVGTTRQFVAQGTYTDLTVVTLTSQVVWSSSNPSAVSMSNNTGSRGVATTLQAGTTTVSAVLDSVTGNATLVVLQASLVSIDLAPTNGSTVLGYTRQFVAIGNYSDGTTQIITSSVTWSVDNQSKAIISPQGLLSTVAAGLVNVTAASGSVSTSTAHTVAPAQLIDLSVLPSPQTMSVSEVRAFTAWGTYSDGSTQNLTASVTWSTSNNLASVSNTSGTKGFVTALAAGSVNVTAVTGSFTRSANVTVQ